MKTGAFYVCNGKIRDVFGHHSGEPGVAFRRRIHRLDHVQVFLPFFKIILKQNVPGGFKIRR